MHAVQLFIRLNIASVNLLLNSVINLITFRQFTDYAFKSSFINVEQ